MWSDGAIVYVGQSINLRARARRGHAMINRADEVSWIELPNAELDFAECYYIGTLRPERNFQKWNGKSRYEKAADTRRRFGPAREDEAPVRMLRKPAVMVEPKAIKPRAARDKVKIYKCKNRIYKGKQYFTYQVAFQHGGKRHRFVYSDLARATVAAREIGAKLRAGAKTVVRSKVELPPSVQLPLFCL